MKNLFKLFSILTLLIMIGCAEDTNIVSPADATNASIDINKVNWIGLPIPDDILTVNGKNSVNNDQGADQQGDGIFSASELINGRKGGTVVIKSGYNGGIHGRVEVEASIKFPSKAFEGDKIITMTIDDFNGKVDFSPSSQFIKAGHL